MGEMLKKQDVLDSIYAAMEKTDKPDVVLGLAAAMSTVKKMQAAPVNPQESCDDMGEVSDGYHTFNQLYHQRAVLFATIVNQNKDKSWKSFKHSDGKYCFDSNGEWFIVGIDTPQGSYTYHYAKDYWDMFDCEELERGKEWDGHTEEDVTRLLSLQNEPCTDAISRQAAINIVVCDILSSAIVYGRTEEGMAARKAIVEGLKRLPPVMPAEKQEPCTDAISRQAVIEVIKKCHCEEWVKADIGAPIEALQSVTPAEKVGHWILLDKCSNSGYYCSECHKRVVKEGWSDTVKIIKYCPNCGCAMKGELE